MDKKEVKFLQPGKWAEHKPYLPGFTVEKNTVKKVPEDISYEIAQIAVDAKKAEWVGPTSAELKLIEDERALKELEELEAAEKAAKKDGKKNK